MSSLLGELCTSYMYCPSAFLSPFLFVWFSRPVFSLFQQSVFGNHTHQCVCVYVSGRSACLMALAEGLCSHVNPPPALPATAAQRRSVCLYVTVCVCFCMLQGCSPWGGQAAVLAAVITADSSRQQDLGLRLGFLCQEPAVFAASSNSFPPFFKVTHFSSFPASFVSVHLA